MKQLASVALIPLCKRRSRIIAVVDVGEPVEMPASRMWPLTNLRGAAPASMRGYQTLWNVDDGAVELAQGGTRLSTNYHSSRLIA